MFHEVPESERPPSVTTVMACFNSAQTVGRAVGSVLLQTARPATLIAVDDASSDSTYEALAAMREMVGGDWLRVVRLTTNRGPAYARNIGWDMAETSHVAFLDADDIWSPNKIEWQYPWMRANPEATLSSHGRPVVPDSGAFLKAGQPLQAHWTEVPARRLLWNNPIATSGVMIRTEAQRRFPIGRRYAEDYCLWQQMAFEGGRIFVSRAPLAASVRSEPGASGLSRDLWAMERGELQNLSLLKNRGYIDTPTQVACGAWSLGKFARRMIIGRRR